MNANQIQNPFEVLGIADGADDGQVRAAYLAKVREFPPDRAPEEFEKVRDAYALLRDERSRIRYRLFSVDPFIPLDSLLAGANHERKFVGPDPWLAVLREKAHYAR